MDQYRKQPGNQSSNINMSFLFTQGDFAPQNMMRSIARQVCEQLVNGKKSIFPFGNVCGGVEQPDSEQAPLFHVLLLSLLSRCSTNDSCQHVTEPDPQRHVPQQQPGPSRDPRTPRHAGTPRRARHRRKERFPRKSRFTRPAGRER